MKCRSIAAAIAIVSMAVAPTAQGADSLTEADAAAIAAEAYVYGYPLVLMDISKQVMTAVARPTIGRAPLGQFNDAQTFPDPSFTDVVSPNADTLYSMSWLDLSKEPIVLSLPAMGKRYYLMQMMDAWTNVFASPGTRTTGDGAGNFAVVGPRWQGRLPANVKELRSPTDMVWIIGRTQTNGASDYAAVRAIKQQYKLVPLSAWGTNYQPRAEVTVDAKVDAKTAPVVQANKLTPEQFLSRLGLLMKDNPPAAADAPVVSRLARIGVAPGKPFDPKAHSARVLAAIEKGVTEARQSLAAEGKSLSRVPPVNGWTVTRKVGQYGTDYQQRAIIALVGLGANLPADAVYPMTGIDGDGKPLSGEHKYTVHFPAGQLPPVNAFWSLTMYNTDRFFVKNPINRYAIGDRDKLQLNKDGSLTLYLQHASPGKDRESNWLPAPAEGFYLIMRLYWPKPEVIDGTWTPPAVKRGG